MYQILHIVRYVKLIPGSESLLRNRGNVAFLENDEGIIELHLTELYYVSMLRLQQI